MLAIRQIVNSREWRYFRVRFRRMIFFDSEGGMKIRIVSKRVGFAYSLIDLHDILIIPLIPFRIAWHP